MLSPVTSFQPSLHINRKDRAISPSKPGVAVLDNVLESSCRYSHIYCHWRYIREMEPYPTYEDGLSSEYLPPDYIDPLYIPTPEYLPSDEYPATASYDIPMDYGHPEDYHPPLQPVYEFVPQRNEDRDALDDIKIDDHWKDPDIDDEDDV